jgi:hypothetical protein
LSARGLAMTTTCAAEHMLSWSERLVNLVPEAGHALNNCNRLHCPRCCFASVLRSKWQAAATSGQLQPTCNCNDDTPQSASVQAHTPASPCPVGTCCHSNRHAITYDATKLQYSTLHAPALPQSCTTAVMQLQPFGDLCMPTHTCFASALHNGQRLSW